MAKRKNSTAAALTPEQIEQRRRVDEMNAATRELRRIHRTYGKRAAALACPGIFAPLGIIIDLTESETLLQGRPPLAPGATVH